MVKKVKILVLGHTGFVGSNLCEYFEKRDVDFLGVSKTTGVDLREKEALDEVLISYKPDYIVNCAAHVGSLNYVTEFAGDIISNNTQMILSLYESVSKINKNIVIINPIANCSYPGNALLYKESEWENGAIHNSVLSYGSTRRFLVACSKSYFMQYGVKTINLLVPNMYGEFDSTDPNKAHALNALISKFVKADKEEKNTIEIWGSGKVVREWLYAKDFARVVFDILGSKKLQKSIIEPINIAQKSGLTITELVNIINANFKNKFTLNYDTTKPDGAPKKVMDDQMFRTLFDSFTFENFEKGIKNTVNYYISAYPY